MRGQHSLGLLMARDERYHEARDALVLQLGGKCVECGSIDNLEFDHVDPKTKKYTITDTICLYSKRRLIEEIKKCQLLCHDCHKKKSDADQTTRQHGDHAMYRRGGCRCELCVEGNREYHRQYRATHKRKKLTTVSV